MKLVFYCYGVRLGWGEPPFTQEFGLMFFQFPPARGDTVMLRGINQPAIIQRIDHYRMAIDVTPIEIAVAEDGQYVHSLN
jgi:hypothetical protein